MLIQFIQFIQDHANIRKLGQELDHLYGFTWYGNMVVFGVFG